MDQINPDNPKPQKSQKPPDHSSTSCPPSSKGGWHRLAAAIKRWVAPIGGREPQKSQKPPDHPSTSCPPSSIGGWHRLAVEALDQIHPDNPKPQKSQKPPDHSSTSCPPSSKGGWHRLAVGRLSAAPIVDSQQRQHPLSAPNPSHGAKFFQKVGGTDWRSKGGWHRLSAAGSTDCRQQAPNLGSTDSRHPTAAAPVIGTEPLAWG